MNAAMILHMAKSAKLGLGCVFLLIAIPAVYLFGSGWVRTVAPVAAPLISKNLHIELEAADFQENRGQWPIVAIVTYSNVGPIRGQIRDRAGKRRTDYEISISSKIGVTQKVRCLREYQDACYFNADLGHTDLTKGVVIAITDLRDGRSLMPPSLVSFERKSSYSFALWDALMGI
tara:strand:+ start:1403 stop:1927 length:525 start_codon:yes stop_codon:yes gene_type:complete